MAETRGWFGPALVLVAAITAARVALLALNGTDLFVDEAQYWLWGQELDFGYYSKPPLIAWLIRAVTELAGSDAPFWVRLPAPLLHGLTALILARIGARLYGARAGVLVALVYVTLPMATLGSLMISTDTVMLPALALALGCYLRLLEGEMRRLPWAFAAGVALGLAFMAKYAALYYLGLGALAALIMPQARPGWRAALLGLLGFALVIAPNVLWNLQNGFSTVAHTADNIGWVEDGAQLDLAGLAEFFGAQFAVFGPVLFGTLLWLIVAARREAVPGLLMVLSLPIVAIVCVQALLSGAYANWAAAAFLAGTLAVVPVLMRRPRWLVASFVMNGALCFALPVATVFAGDLRVGGALALERYMGRAAMSEQILAAATANGAVAVISDNRDLLADLFYSGRESALPIYAWPEPGRAPHHYALKHPYAGQAIGPVLIATRADRLPPCPSAQVLAPITGGEGAYQGREIRLFLAPPDCWATP